MSNVFRIKTETKPDNNNTRWFSKRQEDAVAKAIGGKQTKNSGATMFQKSDVLTEDFTIECKTKTTNSESISIKREWFEKQLKESIQMHKKYSAIVINFGPDEPYNENHYIIDERLFTMLLDYIAELKSELE